MNHAKASNVAIVRYDRHGTESVNDAVAVEEPLEIRIGEEPLAVTMRTPGNDHDLVIGFLLTEGILLDPTEIVSVDTVGESTVAVRLREGVDVDVSRFRRNMFVSSSCGVCGKTSIESVRLLAPTAKPFSVDGDLVATLTTLLGERQPIFELTGGLHGAGIMTLDGKVLSVREDVGRHNAVDKAIGATARIQWPFPQSLLVVSGRQSFEIVQKAAMTGIGGVVGVSAPSSLAIELADTLGMLLVGFSRHEHFNVYCGTQHLDL